MCTLFVYLAYKYKLQETIVVREKILLQNRREKKLFRFCGNQK